MLVLKTLPTKSLLFTPRYHLRWGVCWSRSITMPLGNSASADLRQTVMKTKSLILATGRRDKIEIIKASIVGIAFQSRARVNGMYEANG